MRTGNPDVLKAEAKKCGSHYFDKGTMRFFASRLSPQLHPSETGQDATYFVTSEKFESQRLGDGPRRYSVHRFKGCKIDTVGEFQRFRTGGAAHTAAKRLARGTDSDGLGAFLPASGLGKLVLFGGLGLAAGATALYFIRRGTPAPGGATRKPTPAASVPAGPVDDPSTMYDETKPVVLRPATYVTGAEGKWVVTELPADPKTSTGRVSWVPPYSKLQWTPGGSPHVIPNPPTASSMKGFAAPAGLYDEPAYEVMH